MIESTKLEPFIAEVFSTASILSLAHETILRNLMERQRIEWPLVSIAQVHNHGKNAHSQAVDHSDGHIPPDYVGNC